MAGVPNIAASRAPRQTAAVSLGEASQALAKKAVSALGYTDVSDFAQNAAKDLAENAAKVTKAARETAQYVKEHPLEAAGTVLKGAVGLGTANATPRDCGAGCVGQSK